MQDIAHNLTIIHQRINRACDKAGRSPEDIRLLLATKTVSEEKLRFAVRQGETLLGENKVQDGMKMAAQLTDLQPEWHFIGHLQTNKIKDVLKWATCIQSVDRRDLIEKLDQRLQFEGRRMDILLQVNTSYESSKFGAAPEQAPELARLIQQYPTLNLKGLMTIGLFSAETEQVRKCFRLLKTIQSDIQQQSGIEAPVLSMGMSGDLETAIEEGTTLLRVGTAIFGQRIYPDSHYWNESEKPVTGQS